METLKQREERKRDLAYDPAERWRQMQRMIAWAEANLPPRLRRNRPRTRQEPRSCGASVPPATAAVLELKEQIFAPTLAQKLGDTLHLSPLLRKVQRASGCSENVAQWLLKVAVERGATHYERDFAAELPPDNPTLTNEEIGVALCLGHMPDDPTLIRAAAQLLSSPRTQARRLAHLAVMERVEPVLLHIANACQRVDPVMQPWVAVRATLPCRRTLPDGILPHWTRFVSMTGITRQGGPQTEWLRRYE